MTTLKKIFNYTAILFLLLPSLLAGFNLTTVNAAEEEELLFEEADRGSGTVSYLQKEDTIEWQVTLKKLGSQNLRQLMADIQFEGIDVATIQMLKEDGQLTKTGLTYQSELTVNQTVTTLSFSTPVPASEVTMKLTPKVVEVVSGNQVELPFLQPSYQKTFTFPTVKTTSTTEETGSGEETNLSPANQEATRASDDDTIVEKNDKQGIVNPLLGNIIQTPTLQSNPNTNEYHYTSDEKGNYVTNGTGSGDVYNYNYGITADPGVEFDDENFVQYGETAYLKKSAKENQDTEKPGLFDVTLDMKGNQVEHPIDIVFVVDYSSTMTGVKLENTITGIETFLDEIEDSLGEDTIKVGMVAYNRYVYSTGAFYTEKSKLYDFMENQAESHTGTFIQKGLDGAEELFETQGRSGAQRMLIHIGDDSANRAYLPAENATVYQNTGEITAMNGYSADTYVTEFQSDSPRYYNTSESTDSNSILADRTLVSNLTLGTAVRIKTKGIEIYSVGVNPSSRGMYIGKNLASSVEQHYLSIDEDLTGLGEALGTVSSQIDKTISNGTVSDPMGDGILLQKKGENLSAADYELKAWRRVDGTSPWKEAPDLLSTVKVTEKNGVIQLTGLNLGRNERVTLTYQIRLNTEAADFQAETWYLANGRTTLDPTSSGNKLDFPIPSIKAPGTKLEVNKKWLGDEDKKRPQAIEVVVSRTSVTSADSWMESEPVTISNQEGWQKEISQITPKGQQTLSDLPLYNNQGDLFTYHLKEVNNDGYQSDINNAGNNFEITNTLKTIDLTFEKVSLAESPLKGAEFTLWDDQGEEVATATSDSKGKVLFEKLSVGKYVLKETKAPEKYQLLEREFPLEVTTNSQGELVIMVDYGDGNIEEFTDSKIYNLPIIDMTEPDTTFKFYKYIQTSEGQRPVEGVVFKLTSLVDRGQEYTAVSDGEGLVFQRLPMGVYLLEEVTPPTGYTPIKPTVVVISPNQMGGLEVTFDKELFESNSEGQLTIVNRQQLSLRLQKVDDNHQPLAGAIFELQDETGQTIASGQTSNQDGWLTFENLDPGTYYLVETQTPVGYQKAPKKKIVLDYNAAGELVVVSPENWDQTIENKQLVDFKFRKINTNGKPLRGVTFELRDVTGTIIGEPQVSDVNGEVVFTGISQGTYSLVETKAPENYYLNDQPITVEIGYDETNQLTVLKPSDWQAVIVNEEKTVDFHFTKVDERQQPLAGSIFEIRDESGRLVKGPTTSDQSGKVEFKQLSLGKYYLVEIQAPNGYQTIEPIEIEVTLDNEGQPIITKPNQWSDKQVIANQPMTADFQFTKVGYDGEALAGATFVLKDSNEQVIQGPITSGTDGKVIFPELTQGNYWLVETKAPAGYQVREPIPVKVAIDENGKLIAMPDVGDEHADLWDGKIYNHLDVVPEEKTNLSFIKKGLTADGASPLAGVEFQLASLYHGTSYQATSNQAGKVTFTDVEAGYYALTESNPPAGYTPIEPIFVRVYWDMDGALHVDYPNDNDSFEFEDGLPILYNYQGTQLIFTKEDDLGNPLAGAEFQLTDPDGQTSKIVSDENGQLILNNIKASDYHLEETKAPAGYQKAEAIDFTVGYNQEGLLAILTPKDFNQKIVDYQMMDIPITKINDKGEVLRGAEFQLLDSKHQVIQSATSDYNGKILFTDVIKGKYFIKESIAPTGYQLLEKEIAITVDYDEKGQLQVTSPSGWSGDIENQHEDSTPSSDGSQDSSQEESQDSAGKESGKNTTGKPLPSTGEKLESKYLVMGVVLFLVAVVLVIQKRKKQP